MINFVTIFSGRRNPFKGHNTRLLIIRGCTGSTAFLSLVTAIRLLPISMAMVFFYSFPAFAAVFSFLIFKERISKTGIICIVAVLIGVMILFDFRLEGGLIGQVMGLLTGAFAGITVTFIKELRAKNGPSIIYLYFCTMGCLVTLPAFISAPVIPTTKAQWLMCVGIVFLHDPVTWKFWTGGLLIVGSVMVINIGNVRGSVQKVHGSQHQPGV